jgi:hypothetical protein
MSPVIDALPLPEVYYNASGKDYYRVDARGRWIPVDKESAKQFLQSQGFSTKSRDGEVSPVNDVLLSVQTEHVVDYAAPLAGYMSGFRTMNGNHVLVTASPRLITPEPGSYATIDNLLERMLNDPIHDQRPYLFGWLKEALEAVYNHRFSPTQVLALAGPVKSGKSLLQSLITEMLGGRAAKPYLFMIGSTNFNADLFRAEHLVIEDDAESTDYRARNHFASNIKKIAVNRDHQCHGKHKDAIHLQPIWRMTISVNDDPERLLVLPPISPDVADKISLLKVRQCEMPMPTTTQEEKEQFWRQLVSELPAFIHFLQSWEVPVELRCSRGGTRHYHHPDILAVLDEHRHETRLLALIDMHFFQPSQGYLIRNHIELSSVEIERQLLSDNGEVARLTGKLLTFNNACGVFLSKLAQQQPHRVTSRLIHGTRVYRIHPPQNQVVSCDLGGGVEGLTTFCS